MKKHFLIILAALISGSALGAQYVPSRGAAASGATTFKLITELGTITAGVWNGTSITDAYIDDSITVTLAAAATALAANGANCTAGSYPLGVDASGAAENCTDATTEIDSAVATHTAIGDAHVGADHIDAITEIAAALKSGADTTLITGTIATTNAVVAPNVDDDLVEYGGLTWNVTAATCTGDGNSGALTVNVSDQIVCSADDGGAGGYTSWTLAGDAGTPQTIADGNTATVAGDGVGIDTSAGATDTVTVSYVAADAEAENEGVLDLQDLQGAVTDGQVPNNITIDLATLATTATTANAGDSATAFFSAGTIEHERGGLETDVSAYAGLVRVAAGATSEVTNLSGLNTALGSIAIQDTGTLTDTRLCTYDSAGSEIDCDTELSTFGASLINDADADPARDTLGIDPEQLYSDTDTGTYALGSNSTTTTPTPGSWTDLTGLEVTITDSHAQDSVIIEASVDMDATAGTCRLEIGTSINGADPAADTIRALDDVTSTAKTITTRWLNFNGALANTDTVSFKARTNRSASGTCTGRVVGTHSMQILNAVDVYGQSRPVLIIYGGGMGAETQTASPVGAVWTTITSWQSPYLDLYGLWDTSHYDYVDLAEQAHIINFTLTVGAFQHDAETTLQIGLDPDGESATSTNVHRFATTAASELVGARTTYTIPAPLITGDVDLSVRVGATGNLTIFTNRQNLNLIAIETIQ